jgi:hypothetical protein
VRESYQHFARTMLDFFWSPRLTTQNFSRYVEFENRERWDEEGEVAVEEGENGVRSKGRKALPRPKHSRFGCSKQR